MKYIFSILLSALLIACGNSNNKANESQGDINNSGNLQHTEGSNDSIAGTYMGDYPCATCRMLKVVLTLRPDGKGNYFEKQIGNKDDKGNGQRGSWSLDANTNILRFKVDSSSASYDFKRLSADNMQPLENGNPKVCSEDCTLKRQKNIPTPSGAGVVHLQSAEEAKKNLQEARQHELAKKAQQQQPVKQEIPQEVKKRIEEAKQKAEKPKTDKQ
jgi:NlpE N-terminal domain